MLSALALVLAVTPAMANMIDVPASTSAGQIDKRFQQEQQPSAPLQLKLPTPVEQQKLSDVLRAQLEKNKFVLKTVVVEGSTVYKDIDFTSAYQDKIGQTISLVDARIIAANITDKYHADGYILSQAVVPTQDVTSGNLKIRVVEGYIGNVTFEGAAENDSERRVLNSYADAIKSQHPTTMASMERYMLLMNDLPGLSVSGLIRPSNSEFAAADLILAVNQKSIDGSYTFDNRGSKYIGPWQHTVTAGVNSLINAYDRTQVRVSTAMPFKELFGIEVQHDEVLNNEGTKLTVLASHTRTQPADDLKLMEVQGYSDLFEAKVSHPFMRLRQQSLVGRAVFDVRNTSSDVNKDDILSADRLRVGRIGGTYSFLDDMKGSNSVDVMLSQGMNIFEATNKSSQLRSNEHGNSAFTKFNFDVSRLQQLPSNFSLLTSATGQYSFTPLLTDEQFSLGGADFGRAFDPAEALGDSGLGAKAELRYSESVGESYLQSYQLFGFYDLGEAWTRAAASDAAGSTIVSSTGVGTRVNFNDYLSSSLEADVPVIKPHPDSTSYRHNPRIFFTLSAHF